MADKIWVLIHDGKTVRSFFECETTDDIYYDGSLAKVENADKDVLLSMIEEMGLIPAQNE